MTIFVGSANPAKLKAVALAVAHQYPEAEIISHDVESGVSMQPFSDEETRKGAQNRALRALQQGVLDKKLKDKEVLGVGLEGGVFKQGSEVWSTVWVAVVTPEKEFFESNGARIRVPEPLASELLAGKEMGPVLDEWLTKSGMTSVRHDRGMIGVVTGDFTDRIEEYGSIAKMAFGLWFGKNWRDKIDSLPSSD